MEKKEFPFQIGEHYEKWEFDLEILSVERIKGYDSYTYLREIQIFDIKADCVELIFLFDVLEFVILIFSFKTEIELLQFTIKIKNEYSQLCYKKNELLLKLYYGNLSEKAEI